MSTSWSFSHNSNVKIHTQYIQWAGKSPHCFAQDRGPFFVQPNPKAEQLQARLKKLTYLQSSFVKASPLDVN